MTREQMAAFMRRLAQYLGAEDGTPGLADTVSDGAITNTKIANDVVVARAHGQVFHNASVSHGQNLSSSNVTTPIRRHILILGIGAIALVGWSTWKVDPLPAGIKLDMDALQTTARLLGVGVITGLVAGGLIAAARQAQDQDP